MKPNEAEHLSVHRFLDMELQQFALLQAAHRYFPTANSRYELRVKPSTQKTPSDLEALDRLVHQIARDRVPSSDDISWMRRTGVFENAFLSWLQNVHFDPSLVEISRDENGHVLVQLNGPWSATLLWREPLLRSLFGMHPNRESLVTDTKLKAPDALAKVGSFTRELSTLNAAFVDFSSTVQHDSNAHRRSLSAILDTINEGSTLATPGLFSGTSNGACARELGLPWIGQIDPDWLAVHEIYSSRRSACSDAHLRWLQLYGPRFDVATVDADSSRHFFETFDQVLAESYRCLHAEVENPFLFIDEATNFYRAHGIDARQKYLRLRVPPDSNLIQRLIDHNEHRCRLIFALSALDSTSAQTPNESPHWATFRLSEFNGHALGVPAKSPHPPQAVPSPTAPWTHIRRRRRNLIH